MLMKYPPIADMQYFIDMARYLREPNVRCSLLTDSVACIVKTYKEIKIIFIIIIISGFGI